MNNKLKKITLNGYYRELLDADWFYDYSDCFDTRNRARKNISILKKIGECHPIANKLWRDCQEYVGKLRNNSNTKDFYCPKINAEFSFR